MRPIMSDLHNRLLQREMTRQEFLQYVAGAVVVLFGLSNLLSFFNPFAKGALSSDKKLAHADAKHGFGSRKFGV